MALLERPLGIAARHPVAVSCVVAALAGRRWLVTWVQRAVSDALGGGGWTNLGCPVVGGEEGQTFASSCEALCRVVASEVKDGAHVLSVGCGRGAELRFLRRWCRARSVAGVDAAVDDAAAAAARSLDVSLRRVAAGDIGAMDDPPRLVDAVVCCDAAYHFGEAEERRFYEGAFRVLADGGTLGASHVVFATGTSWWTRRIAALVLGTCCDVRVWPSAAALEAEIRRAGLADARVEGVDGVLERWPVLGPLVRGRVRYVVARARKVGGASRDRRRVAVVGAGLSGLARAGREQRASTSLQRGRSRSTICWGTSIHALRSPRELTARRNMSQIESKAIEMGGFQKLANVSPFVLPRRARGA